MDEETDLESRRDQSEMTQHTNGNQNLHLSFLSSVPIVYVWFGVGDGVGKVSGPESLNTWAPDFIKWRCVI